MQEAGIKTDPFLVTVMIGMTRLLFTFLAAYLSKVVGRRPAAIMSGVGMAVSLLTLATHLYLLTYSTSSTPMVLSISSPTADFWNSTEEVFFNVTSTQNVTQTLEAADSVSFLPLSMLLLYILASTIGFLTLPWSMIGEVYPAQVRGVSLYQLFADLQCIMMFTTQVISKSLDVTICCSRSSHGFIFLKSTCSAYISNISTILSTILCLCCLLAVGIELHPYGLG